MYIRKLSKLNEGSFGVRLPKEHLEYDDILDDGELPENGQQMILEREGPGEWTVRTVPDESTTAD